MFGLFPRHYLILAACVAVMAAYGLGRVEGARVGVAREVARQRAAVERLQADYDAAADRVTELSAEIEDWREASRKLSLEIEDEARADPEAAGRVPGPDSLRRLERRWGQDLASP